MNLSVRRKRSIKNKAAKAMLINENEMGAIDL